MMQNPIGELALVSTIYEQNVKLMQSYPNSLSIQLKSRLLSDFYKEKTEVYNLLNEFERKSYKNCRLDVCYGYLPAIDCVNAETILYSDVKYLIFCAQYNFLFAISDKIYFIDTKIGKIIDSFYKPITNKEFEEYRIVLNEIPDVSGSGDKSKLNGIIIAFDRFRISHHDFYGNLTQIKRYAKVEIVQLNVLNRDHILVGIGNDSANRKYRKAYKYEIINIKTKENVLKIDKEFSLIETNLNDFEVFLPYGVEFYVFLIGIDNDGKIEVYRLKKSVEFKLELMSSVPTPGLNINRVIVDRIYFNDCILKRMAKNTNDKSLFRFGIYFDPVYFSVFDLKTSESDGDKINEKNVEIMIKRFLFSEDIHDYYDNILVSRLCVYKIDEDVCIPIEEHTQATILSEYALLTHSKERDELYLTKFSKMSKSKQIQMAQVLKISPINTYLSKELFCISRDGKIVYQCIKDDTLKAVSLQDAVKYAIFGDDESEDKVRFSTRCNICVIDEYHVLCKIAMESQIAVVDVRNREIEGVIEDETFRFVDFRYNCNACIVLAHEAIIVYLRENPNTYEFIENEIIMLDELSFASLHNILFKEIENEFLVQIYLSEPHMVRLYKCKFEKTELVKNYYDCPLKQFKIKFLNGTDHICVTHLNNFLIIISHKQGSISVVNATDNNIIFQYDLANYDILPKISNLKPIEGTNDVVFVEHNGHNVYFSDKKNICYLKMDIVNNQLIDLNLLRFDISSCFPIETHNWFYLMKDRLILLFVQPSCMIYFNLSNVAATDMFVPDDIKPDNHGLLCVSVFNAGILVASNYGITIRLFLDPTNVISLPIHNRIDQLTGNFGFVALVLSSGEFLSLLVRNDYEQKPQVITVSKNANKPDITKMLLSKLNKRKINQESNRISPVSLADYDTNLFELFEFSLKKYDSNYITELKRLRKAIQKPKCTPGLHIEYYDKTIESNWLSDSRYPNEIELELQELLKSQ